MQQASFTFLLAALALLAPGAPAGAATASPVGDEATEADRAALTHLKTILWPQAYRESDVALLDRILDPRFVLIDDAGERTAKAEELALLPGYRWTHESFDYAIERLEVFGGDMAIIAGEGRATGEGTGGRYCLSYRSSNVLVRRPEGWRAVLSHVSGVDTACGPEQPDG